ncbi:MAG: hypothetical protein AAB425_09395, partial [Bdellovibrionota bacterium]
SDAVVKLARGGQKKLLYLTRFVPMLSPAAKDTLRILLGHRLESDPKDVSLVTGVQLVTTFLSVSPPATEANPLGIDGLVEFADSPNPGVRMAIANKTPIGSALFAKFAHDPDIRVAARVLSRPIVEAEKEATEKILRQVLESDLSAGSKILAWTTLTEGGAKPLWHPEFLAQAQSWLYVDTHLTSRVVNQLLIHAPFSRELIDTVLEAQLAGQPSTDYFLGALSKHPKELLSALESKLSLLAPGREVWLTASVRAAFGLNDAKLWKHWLSSTSPTVRAQAAGALPFSQRAWLLPLLKDESEEVVLAALNALWSFSAAVPENFVLRKLESRKLRRLALNATQAVRERAISILLNSGATETELLQKMSFSADARRSLVRALLHTKSHADWKLELAEKLLQSEDLRDRYLATFLASSNASADLTFLIRAIQQEKSP